MVENALNQFDGPIRIATSATLEEGADRSPLAPRAGDLNYVLLVMLSTDYLTLYVPPSPQW